MVSYVCIKFLFDGFTLSGEDELYSKVVDIGENELNRKVVDIIVFSFYSYSRLMPSSFYVHVLVLAWNVFCLASV